MGALNKISLFSSLTEKQCGELEKKLITRTFNENELILDFEDQSSDVLFITSGKVRVLYRSVLGREVILADLAEGDFFGELSAIDGKGRSANVTALQRTEISRLSSSEFLELATTVPQIAKEILNVLVSRIRALDLRFSEMSVLKTNERLYAELLRLSQPRRSNKEERIISPPPFHHHLAGRIGCRREVVSREISALTKVGILEKTRGGLVILDVAELEGRIAAALN
jgi:CRP-like cAMP-binding protein